MFASVFGVETQVPMNQYPSLLQVRSHGLTLPLFGLGDSMDIAFPELVEKLRDYSFKHEARERAIQHRTCIGRTKACTIFIDGLYQAYCSNVLDTAVAFPHSQKFYKKNQQFKIGSHSYRQIDATYRALIALGWVTYCPGFKRADGQTRPTSVAPAGELLDWFRKVKPKWRRVFFTSDPIILRMKDKQKKDLKKIMPPDTPQVQNSREQLNRLNEFLVDQAICLGVPNSELKALATAMAGHRYSYVIGAGLKESRARVLNFPQVGLRRIFAKGRMDRGGRMYGGWWQTVPKDYRRFITINGRPTVEVDFSELHPTMLYILANQKAPENIYDVGIMTPGDSPYDSQIEPHKSRRKIIKKFMNALINDEQGLYRLSAADSNKLGMSHEQLKQAVVDKHPVLVRSFCTDAGLYLQFLDSEIAIRVMMRLMSQQIVALPIHDSFLVQVEFEQELMAAMREEFTAVFSSEARLKDPELPQNFFEQRGYNRNLVHLLEAHNGSLHDDYVMSWQQQHPTPAHSNLSRFPPYRFPDGELA